MESKTQTVEETTDQSMMLWIGESGSREITLFDMQPEEVKRVAKLFGVELTFGRRKEGGVWKDSIRARDVRIGTLKISLHSRYSPTKTEEATA